MFAFAHYRVIFISAITLVALLTLGFTYHVLDVSSISEIGRTQREQSTEQPTEQSTELVQPINQQPAEKKPYIPLLPKVDELYSLTPVRQAPTTITSTVFMFRGDFSSQFYDLFALHKRATRYCDNDTTIDGCDVKLPRNYRWGTLSYKLLDTLDLLCKESKKTDFYVKIDDDLIMPESKLDEAIRVMAATDCQVAGGIARDFGFYWPVGQVYIFKRAILESICAKFPITRELHPSEDITFGSFINSTDKSMFCNLVTPRTHWHQYYRDQRVWIKYTPQHNE